MGEGKHTPTPWEARPFGKESRWHIIDPRTHEIICRVEKWSPEADRADAAFIVLAVNSHDALVEALTDARLWLAGQPDRSQCKAETLSDLQAKIDAALSAASERAGKP
jgi:hypothetical protein